MSAEGRAFDVFAGSAPPERLAVVRIAVFGFGALYLAVRSTSIMSVTDLDERRFAPIGPVSLLDDPIGSTALLALLVVTIAACVAATVGYRWRVSSVVAAVGLAMILTYRLSWGQVLHTENLLVAHAILLAFMPAADAWAVDARELDHQGWDHRGFGARERESWVYGWALQTLAVATVVGYLLAAWAKAKNGGVDWVTGDVLRNHIAYDNLQKKLLGDVSSPFASVVVPYGWLFPPMAAASMVIEIGALAAIARGTIRTWWVAFTWLFHVAILALMAILFPYQLLGIAFLPFLKGEEIVRRFSRAFRRRREAQHR